MIELGIGICTGGVAAMAATSYWLRSRKKVNNQSEKRDIKDTASLIGLKMGVYIKEPNGVASPIQNRVEGGLIQLGAAVFDLERDAIQQFLKKGTWNDAITLNGLDMVAIGHIVVRQDERDQYVFPTVQHIQTSSGLPFHVLRSDDPEMRVPNRFNDSDYFDKNLSGYKVGPELSYYFESDAEFKLRRAREKVLVGKISVTGYTLDVRVYGSNGQMYTSFNEAVDSASSSEPLRELGAQLIDQIISCTPVAMAAHTRAESIAEIGGEKRYVSPENMEEMINLQNKR
jgi:hypothetical protein